MTLGPTADISQLIQLVVAPVFCWRWSADWSRFCARCLLRCGVCRFGFRARWCS